MSRLHSLIASGLIVVGLAVSGTLVGVPSPTRDFGARAEEQSDRSQSSTEPATSDADDPGTSTKPGDRASGRRERGGGSDRMRPKPGRGDQKQSQNAQRTAEDRTDQILGRVGNPQDRCTGRKHLLLLESEACTHGPDPAPPGLKVSRRVQPLTEQTSSQQIAELATITCVGDGRSGPRVQVLYVRASDVPSRYTQYLSSFRGWAGAADQIFQTSGAETGGSRNLRFVHDASCQPTVPEVVVSPDGDRSFNSTISELKNQGFNRTDRIYLAFVDTTAAGICGVGTLWDDDQPGKANWNNAGPSYARVDAGCWNGYTAAHELMHNLGGVQLSAPNTSGGWHCIDESDVMCYSDSPKYPRMRNDCASAAENLFDCTDDDYYNVAPAAGSYLASHWNAANSQFLIGTTNPAPGPTESSVRLVLPDTVKRRTSLEVEATTSGNVASVAFGVCKGTKCTWKSARKLGTDTAAPFSVSWKAPKRGTFTFLARGTDDAGKFAMSAPKTVKVVRTVAGTGSGAEPATGDPGASVEEHRFGTGSR